MTSETLKPLPLEDAVDDENRSKDSPEVSGGIHEVEDPCSCESGGGRKKDTSGRPLSWEQARSHVRLVLEEYMKTKPPFFHESRNRNGEPSTRLSWWWRYDLDFYAATLPASFAVLILSCVSFSSRRDGEDSALNARADLKVYKAQIAAAALLVTGTLFSILLVWRRRDTCTRDSDVGKRHTIFKYLRAMKKTDEEQKAARSHSGGEAPDDVSNSHSAPLSGTSLTDIYPTYRRSATELPVGGSWHRIPTLLLVRGDYISLQVGDIAPAECKMVETGASGKVTASVVIAAGERVTLESFGRAATVALSELPVGQDTLSAGSRNLLTLCNNMRIFIVQETPLEGFLRLPPGEKYMLTVISFPCFPTLSLIKNGISFTSFPHT